MRVLGAASWMRNLGLLPELVDLLHRGDESADLGSLVVRLGCHGLVLAHMHHL